MEVEFFGIVRQRTEVASAEVPVNEAATLKEVLSELARRFPKLVPDCIDDGQLTKICVANVNGDRFLVAGDTVLEPTDRLLLMSADGGG